MVLTPARACAATLLAASLVVASAVPGEAVPVTAGRAAAVGADTVGGPELASTGYVVRRGPDAKPLPKVVAESWVLADLTTGEVLAAKNPHRRARPASTLKTLTAVTLLPVLDKDAEHVVTYKEASADGGHVGVVPDAPYTVWDLWHGLLLPSGNDAAAALAGANGGMKKTVRDMQAVADRLQARDTTVRNPSGLDADGQLTSAYDLALFAKAAMANEDFRTLTKTISYDFPGRPAKAGKKRKTYKIYTQNRLLLRGYKGTVGGKTGFTSKAHRTFWAAAQRGGHTLVVTLLQIGQPSETAAESLLSWGFANRTKVTPVGTLVDPLPEGAPAPEGSPSPATGTGTVAGATTPAAATSTGSGVPGWAWILGVLLVLGGIVALVVGRGRRTGDGAEPGPGTGAPAPGGAHAAGATVLPGRAAAATSPSVVVSRPGVAPEPPVAGSSSGAATAAPAGALDATGPVPVVDRPVAPAAASPAAEPAPAPAPSAAPVAEPLPAPDAAAPTAPAPAEPPAPPAAGGNVRVIRPPGPGSA